MQPRHPGVTWLAAHGAAVMLLGCMSTIDAAFDPQEDFTRFQVWDFEPAGASRVEAHGKDEAALEARLRRLIHRELAARGYRHGRERPDFFVRYTLSLESRRETVHIPRAPYLLSSMSSSPSYWIWGSDREERTYEDVRLSLDVSEGSGQRVWTGSLRERLEYGRSAHIDAAVKSVLERFPRARPRRPREPSSMDQLAFRLPAAPEI